MFERTAKLEESGLEVVDIAHDESFQARRLHQHDAVKQLEGVKRLARAFVEDSDRILQVLVEAAVALCGADSAAVSLVKENGTDDAYYHWVASAGEYGNFLDALLPRYPSACGVCLERNRPQRIRVTGRFFEILGVSARPVTDGLLLPWRVSRTAGTIFVMAHERTEAFDASDLSMMEMLADFAAMGIRQIEQRSLLIEQAKVVANADLANELAHEINNPLQCITNRLFLAMNKEKSDAATELATEINDDLTRLNDVAGRLLSLPKKKLSALNSERA